MNRIVIAIDGPAASGKSTTARLVADRLGYVHIDTGAMYRAMTLKVVEQGISPDDLQGIKRVVDGTTIELKRETGKVIVVLDDRDVTKKIRTPEITRMVSVVSRIREVREAMVREQRRMATSGGVVLEGRDIGTVVLPNAELKVYMIADVETRARRRQEELGPHGLDVGLQKLIEEIRTRDEKDSTRDESPLKRAQDALEIDTSNLTIAQQVEVIVEKAQEFISDQSA